MMRRKGGWIIRAIEDEAGTLVFSFQRTWVGMPRGICRVGGSILGTRFMGVFATFVVEAHIPRLRQSPI